MAPIMRLLVAVAWASGVRAWQVQPAQWRAASSAYVDASSTEERTSELRVPPQWRRPSSVSMVESWYDSGVRLDGAAVALAEIKKADIVDTAVAAGSFKTLAAALGAAGLVDTMKSAGPFTVFAPTDDAFAKLPAGTVEELLKPENKAKLAAILTYHVVSGKVMASTVVTMDGAKVPTVNGAEATIKVGTDGVMVDGAKVVTTDIECANGVIHVIDSVILPAAAKAYSVDELKQEGEAVVASRMTTQAAYQALAKEAKILADDDVASFLARAQMRSAARATARADTAKGTPEPVAAAPARVAKAATRVPSPPPSSPAPGGALSVETARSVNQLLEIDTRSIRLPETVVEYFESQDLLVPNCLDEEQQDSWLGAIAAGTGLLFALNLFEIGAGMDLLLSAIIGGGLSGYAALRKDGVGDVARTAGKVANKGALATYASAKKLNEEYELTEKAKAKAVELVKQATEKLKQSLKQ